MVDFYTFPVKVVSTATDWCNTTTRGYIETRVVGRTYPPYYELVTQSGVRLADIDDAMMARFPAGTHYRSVVQAVMNSLFEGWQNLSNYTTCILGTSRNEEPYVTDTDSLPPKFKVYENTGCVSFGSAYETPVKHCVGVWGTGLKHFKKFPPRVLTPVQYLNDLMQHRQPFGPTSRRSRL